MSSYPTVKKTKQKRNLALLFLCLLALFSLCHVLLTDTSQQQELVENYTIPSTIAENERGKSSTSKMGLYVPSIEITKVGNPNGEEPCTKFDYVYTVSNTSTAAEVLLNVVLTDPQLGGVINGPDSGDAGNDNIMGPGEVWEYYETYNITTQDRINGQILNEQVLVEADVQGQGISVNDSSTETTTDLMDCQPRIGMIKTSMMLDNCLGIVYTFDVQNRSPGGDELENIEIIDPLLGPNPIAVLPVGDNGDGLMQPFIETWTYTVVYDVDETEILSGQIINQATVTTNVVGFPNEEFSDLSDDDNYLQDDPTLTDLTSCQPFIALVKEGNLIDNCEDIVYRFYVSNHNISGLPLENVEIVDPLFGPNPIMFPAVIVGDDGDELLEIGETWEYEIVYKITQSDRNAGEVKNQATVTANLPGLPNLVGTDLSDDNSILENDPTITDLSICQPRIALRKTAMINDFCDEITYTFEVRNQGPQVLTNLVLTDPLFNAPIAGPDSGDDNNDGNLDLAEVWFYEAVYNVTHNDLNQGFVENQATITSNVEGFPNSPVSDLSDHTDFVEDRPTVTDISSCQNIDIGLIKTAALFDLDGNNCDDHIEYTFVVKNIGNVDLEEVTLEDTLLGGEVSGPFSGDIGNDGILSPNEEWTYIAFYDITQQDIDNGNVDNQAEVKAILINDPNTQIDDESDDDSYFEDNGTTIDLEEDVCDDYELPLGLVKTAQLLDIDNNGCDDHIHYTFTIKNLSDVNLTQVTFEDNLLGGAVPGPDSGDLGNDDVLSPDEEWIYNALYDITQNDIDQGQVQNQAIVKAFRPNNNQIQDLSDDDSFSENQPTITPVDGSCDNHGSPIGIIKQGQLLDQGGDGCDDTIQYTFTVTNVGPIDLASLVLTDDLLENDLSNPTSGDTNEDGILSTDEVWTFVAFYGITQNDVDAEEVVNQAMVTANLTGFNIEVSDISDDDSYLEDDPTTTIIDSETCKNASSGLGLIKEGELIDQNNDGCNETISYTFTVRNTGTSNLDAVVLSDELLDNISGPGDSDVGNDGVLSIDEEWTYTGFYTIVQADLQIGTVENQATVTAEPVNTDNQVLDLSDNNSFSEGQPTITSVVGACVDGSNFEIFNGITPNGDGVNDYFHIEGIENYPNNTVKIFNRWGVEVYKVDGYGQGTNLFYGISQARATISEERELPSGTYFYILEFQEDNPGQANYSGYIYINRD
ncbi:gliding motility-associated C-terminal domain-containing protein [Flagellimonas sp.]|uniref:gliding motility-associated C-terminal domain-containing protein n=1 Tax=Flagellimonas sp. TaxID=2058762 RepID=UPI003B598C10